MQNWGFSKIGLRLTAIVGVLAGMLTLVSCGGGGEQRQVAATNTTVPVNTTTVRALEGATFSLPAGAFTGAPALATQATTVRFTNTTAATPTATITATNGTATGNTTFGSCIFTVTSSTIPGVTVNQQITVNPCQYNVQTSGIVANGQATTVNILLQLGVVPSAANQATVSIDQATGVVTVNNVNTGVNVTLQVSTGAAGG